MAAKAILDTLDGLSDEKKADYKKDAETGKYYLDVEDFDSLPQVGALKRAKDHEKKARTDSEKAAKEIRERLDALTEERNDILRGAIPKGDVEKLEGSWKTKLAAREKELSDEIASLNGQLSVTLVDSVAHSLATKIAKKPAVLLPHIKARLTMATENGKAVTRVKDADGNISALTVADLEKEMIANTDFADVIIGSKASGGGAAGGSGGSGAPAKIDPSAASPRDLAAHIKAKKEAGA